MQRFLGLSAFGDFGLQLPGALFERQQVFHAAESFGQYLRGFAENLQIGFGERPGLQAAHRQGPLGERHIHDRAQRNRQVGAFVVRILLLQVGAID